MKFVVASNGTVSSATIKASTLDSAEVEDCLTHLFMGMTFPAPSGGGVAIVSYPLTFSPG